MSGLGTKTQEETQVQEPKINQEKFIFEKHHDTLNKHNLQLSIRFENGIYKAYIAPKISMTDAELKDNFKNALTEITEEMEDSTTANEIKQFNMLMLPLVQTCNEELIGEISALNMDEQKALMNKFISKIKESKIVLGEEVDKSQKAEGIGTETSSLKERNIYLISHEEIIKWLEDLKRQNVKGTYESAKGDGFGKALVNEYVGEDGTGRVIADGEKGISGKTIATVIGTTGKPGEMTNVKEATGVIVIIKNDEATVKFNKRKEEIRDGLLDLEEYKIDKDKDKENFGFYEEAGNLYVRMKHADGKWKDSILIDKYGDLDGEALIDLSYVANIYSKDTATKSREKNKLSYNDAKKIRSVFTEFVFSIEHYEKAYNEANKKYSEKMKVEYKIEHPTVSEKDIPNFGLTKEGVASAILYQEALEAKEKAKAEVAES